MTGFEEMAKEALDSAKSAHHRIDGLEEEIKDIHNLAETMAAMQEQMKSMGGDISEVKGSIKVITSKPANRWELFVQTLGGALLRAVSNPVIVVSIVASVWTALTDPTTKGFGDSQRALSYENLSIQNKNM
ncbi:MULTISPECIES: phage holin [Caproicibacterium]|nr:phage holin [Caproicibacterium lactatifermentans]